MEFFLYFSSPLLIDHPRSQGVRYKQWEVKLQVNLTSKLNLEQSNKQTHVEHSYYQKFESPASISTPPLARDMASVVMSSICWHSFWQRTAQLVNSATVLPIKHWGNARSCNPIASLNLHVRLWYILTVNPRCKMPAS